MKSAFALYLALSCALPLAAHAQWQWVGKDGQKVFSDKPPPPDVPEKNILSRSGKPPPRISFSDGQPGNATQPAAELGAAPAPAPPGSVAAAAKPSGVDKELEEKTRKAEEAEKTKRAAEAQQAAKAQADNCARARQAKATFDSGIRVARVNAQGQREILDDTQRAAEQQRLKTVMASDCR